MPLYYEDLEAGQVYETPARTMTEADVVGFAALSGDWNPLHTDVEFAKGTIYGRRVVHGLFVLSMMTGLLERAGLFSGSAMAMLGIDGWRFVAPVFIGDTIRARMEIGEVRLTSKEDRAVVDHRFELLNQRDEVVQEGRIGVMVGRAPAGRGLAG